MVNGIKITSNGLGYLTIQNNNPQEKKNIFLLSLVHISNINCESLDNFQFIKDYYIYDLLNNKDKYYLNYIENNNINNTGFFYPKCLLYIDGECFVFYQDITHNDIRTLWNHSLQKDQLLTPSMMLQKIYEKQTIMIETDLENFQINHHYLEFSHNNMFKNKNFRPVILFDKNYTVFKISDMLKINQK